ncbi:ion channel [uncultured Flavobacterium sp.]|uniref:potassium channel family protein n=1 Tax=uncultured Flavobacterium sp. TaxID=165435 RepID=UPI0030EBA017|tara:strand:+ start:8364 stop:8921 length:558 start_codon:yes stop_codon:yes gene_type:complete
MISNSLNKVSEKPFFKLLFGKTALPIIIILGIALIYIMLMTRIDHSALPFHVVVAVAALIKTVVITLTTLKKLSKLIKICHSLERLLWVFGLIIVIIVFSFATDYTCLYQFDHAAFEGIPDFSNTYLYNLYHFFYFSVITFSTVGFGDITPVSDVAKFVIMLEIFLSFFIIVFALTNIKKIHLNE